MAPPPRRTRRWWTVEHGGAPRWLIAFGFVIVLGGAAAFALAPTTTRLPPGAAPAGTAVPSADASASPSASESEMPLVSSTPLTVAFIGDSYAQGAGASNAASRWTSLLSVERGWTENNVARGGSGYLASVDDADAAVEACGLDFCPNYLEVVREVVATDPDVVIVSGGRADVAATDDGGVTNGARALERTVRQTLLALRTGLPDAELFIVSPIWDDNTVPAALTDLQRVLRTNATEVDATYLDIDEPLEGAPELLAADGIDPNDAGHRAIADAVSAALESQ